MNFSDWLTTVPETITDDSLWIMEAYRLGLFAADVSWHDVTKLMQDSVKADKVFPINPNDSIKYPWKDGFIQMSEALLLGAYQVLMIGDKVVRLPENQSPVWLIRTAEGNYFKWQVDVFFKFNSNIVHIFVILLIIPL